MKTRKTKKIIYNIAILLSLSFCTTVSSKMQLGIDFLFSKNNFKKNFGKNAFSKKCTPGLNIFTNYMFNKYIGFELGIEIYKHMWRTVNVVPAGYIFVGRQVPTIAGPDYSESYKTGVRQTNSYFGLISKFKITENSSFNVMLAASLSHIKAKCIMFEAHHPQYEDVTLKEEIKRTFSKYRVMPMIKIFIEYKLSNKFGTRISTSWRQTSLFKSKSRENPTASTCIKAKDSFNFGIGIIYYI